MRIYTRTGDKGKTRLIGGRPVDKDDTRVEAYGTVDELNSFVGKLMAELDHKVFIDILPDLEKIQHELFDCGGDLANVSSKREFKLKEDSIAYLEKAIDELIEQAPDVERFILPGGTKPAATAHIARTVNRRAERLVVRLMRQEPLETDVPLKYLNRLSDYFFALARVINVRMDVRDVEYVRSARVFRNGRRKGDKK